MNNISSDNFCEVLNDPVSNSSTIILAPPHVSDKGLEVS